MADPIRIFLGHDGAESLASVVCQKSIQRRTEAPTRIVLLNQVDLRRWGLYTRPRDPLASTEFTYTRFLTPFLCDYQGWALFVDADFLFQADIADLWALRDARYAVQVVQHAYVPQEKTKMDGAQQTQYPRKNWSSLILWNCGHPLHRPLTAQRINTETGAWLHQFQWVDDAAIGSLPLSWNWLEPMGEPEVLPHAIHYTRGIPGVHPGTFHFAAAWEREMRA